MIPQQGALVTRGGYNGVTAVAHIAQVSIYVLEHHHVIDRATVTITKELIAGFDVLQSLVCPASI